MTPNDIKMKICIITPYFTPYVRGNEYGLAESLAKIGYDVTIITSKGKAPREVKTDFSGEFGFKIKYLPTLSDIAENPVVSGLNLEGYDIALLQEDYPFICHKAYRDAKKQGLNTILSSERTYYPETHVKRIPLKMLDKLTNRKLRNGVDILTAHCSAAKEFMVEELGVKREIEVVYVGVDTDLFKPLEEPVGADLVEGEFKILTVARLHKYKGLEYLIETMQLLQGMSEAKLRILGKGEEEVNLKKRVKRLGLEQKVEFIQEPIPNYEMPSLYRECDIYVQPSIVEPYGIAVLEAMACGKPVIGTKVGGMMDTIKDGETGFLVEPGSPNELAEVILKMQDRKSTHIMGKKARKRVEYEFDWIKIAHDYIDLMETLK